MFKQRVQGFAIGAAAVAAIMVAVPLLNPRSIDPDMDAFAESVGITILWSDVTPCTPTTPNAVGCFTPATPDAIYVSKSLDNESRRFIVMHEIGHALANRLGSNEPRQVREGRADSFARSLGAQRPATFLYTR